MARMAGANIAGRALVPPTTAAAAGQGGHSSKHLGLGWDGGPGVIPGDHARSSSVRCLCPRSAGGGGGGGSASQVRQYSNQTRVSPIRRCGRWPATTRSRDQPRFPSVSLGGRASDRPKRHLFRGTRRPVTAPVRSARTRLALVPTTNQLCWSPRLIQGTVARSVDRVLLHVPWPPPDILSPPACPGGGEYSLGPPRAERRVPFHNRGLPRNFVRPAARLPWPDLTGVPIQHGSHITLPEHAGGFVPLRSGPINRATAAQFGPPRQPTGDRPRTNARRSARVFFADRTLAASAWTVSTTTMGTSKRACPGPWRCLP